MSVCPPSHSCFPPGSDAGLRPVARSDVRSSLSSRPSVGLPEAYCDVVPPAYLDAVTVEDREVRWRDRLVSGAREIALAKSGSAVVGVVAGAVQCF
jgi:hypothetical protein